MTFLSLRRVKRGVVVGVSSVCSLGVLSIPLLAGAQAIPDDTIEITKVNLDDTAPFDVTCQTPLSGEVTIYGNGAGYADPELIENHEVTVNWGDGSSVSTAIGVFTPPTGLGSFTYTFATGPHVYVTSGTYTIEVQFHHKTGPGIISPGEIDATTTLDVCVQIPQQPSPTPTSTPTPTPTDEPGSGTNGTDDNGQEPGSSSSGGQVLGATVRRTTKKTAATPAPHVQGAGTMKRVAPAAGASLVLPLVSLSSLLAGTVLRRRASL